MEISDTILLRSVATILIKLAVTNQRLLMLAHPELRENEAVLTVLNELIEKVEYVIDKIDNVSPSNMEY